MYSINSLMSCPYFPFPRVYNFFSFLFFIYNPLIPSNLHDITYGPSYFFLNFSISLVSAFILFIEYISYGNFTLFFVSILFMLFFAISFFGYFFEIYSCNISY